MKRNVMIPLAARRPLLWKNQEMAERRVGFTIVEMAFYVTILAIVLVPLAVVLGGISRSVSENDAFNKVRERNRAILFRMEEDVRESLLSTVVVENLGKRLRFSVPAGFASGALVVGDSIVYEFRSDPEDPLNGTDDDGNGLIDEGELVRRNATTGQDVVIATGIDLGNSGFVSGANGIRIDVSNMGTIRDSSLPFVVSRSVTVFPRNS